MRVKFVEEIRFDDRFVKYFGVFTEDVCKQEPLIVELVFVLKGVLLQIAILCCKYHLLRPVAEEFNIGHQVQVRLPERLFAFLIFVDNVQS